jgi:hypothetical protein
MGSNNRPVIVLGEGGSGGANTTITENNITNNGQIDSSSFGGLIFANGSSGVNLTLTYNFIHDTGADMVDVPGGTTTMKFNLMMNNGEASGSHPDYLQHNPTGLTATDIISFNTWVQNSASVVTGTQGTTYGDNSVDTVGTTNTFDHNETLSPVAGGSSYIGARVFGPSINTSAAIILTDNFGDITGSLEPSIFFPGSSSESGSGSGGTLTQASFSNNINAVTGAAFSNSP